MKPKPNRDWLAALESAMEQSADKPGKEWLTIIDLQALLGLERSATDRALKKMIASGSVEAKVFTVMRGSQRRHTNHYRLF